MLAHGRADVERAINTAQQELRALEKDADELLARLAEPGTRPLAEAAGVLIDSTSRLAALQSCLALLGPTLAALATDPPTPASSAALDVLWRREQSSGPTAERAAAPAQALPAVVAAVSALPGLCVTPWEGRAPAASPGPATTMLSMLCGSSVAAAVVLSAPGSTARPLRVAVFAPGEERERPGTWPWCESRHLVFRRASAVAAAALQHFGTACRGGPGAGGEQGAQQDEPTPLEMLLLWLATYADLFSRPCSATGALLAADPRDGMMLPPVYRPYRLTWAQLREAAADPSQRAAYHWHSRPEEGEGHAS